MDEGRGGRATSAGLLPSLSSDKRHPLRADDEATRRGGKRGGRIPPLTQEVYSSTGPRVRAPGSSKDQASPAKKKQPKKGKPSKSSKASLQLQQWMKDQPLSSGSSILEQAREYSTFLNQQASQVPDMVEAHQSRRRAEFAALQQAKEKIAELEARLEEKDEVLSNLQTHNAQLNKEINRSNQRHASILQEREDVHQAEIAKLRSEFSMKIANLMKDEKKTQEQQESQLSRYRNVDGFIDKIKELEAEHRQLQRQYEQKLMIAEEAHRIAIQEAHAKANADAENIREARQELQEALDKEKANSREYLRQNEILQRQCKKFEAENNNLRSEFGELETENRRLQAERDAMAEEQSRIRSLTGKDSSASEGSSPSLTETDIRQLKAELKQAENKIRFLEAELESEVKCGDELRGALNRAMFRHKDSDNKWREEKNKLVESLRNEVDRIRKMAKEREAKLNDEIASLKSALTHAQGGERATTEQFEKLRNDLRHAQMLNRRYEKSIQQGIGLPLADDTAADKDEDNESVIDPRVVETIEEAVKSRSEAAVREALNETLYLRKQVEREQQQRQQVEEELREIGGELQGIRRRYDSDMEALTKRAQMAETEAAALRRSFDQDTALLREQNITTQAENENLKAELTKAKEEKESHRLVLREVQNDLDRERRLVERLETQIADLENAGARLKEELQAHVSKKDEALQTAHATVEEVVRKAADKVATMSNTLMELREEVVTKNSTISQLNKGILEAQKEGKKARGAAVLAQCLVTWQRNSLRNGFAKWSMFDELHNNTRYMIRLQHEALQEQEVRHQAAAADLRAALEEEAANQLKDKKRQLMEILRMSVEEADATGVANGNEAVARTTQRLNKEHSDAVSELKARHAAQIEDLRASHDNQMQEQLKRQREETQRLKEAKEKAMLAFELETQEMNAEVIKRIEAAVEKAVEEEQAAAEERRQARELEVAKEKEELEAKLRDEFEEVKEVMADEYAVQHEAALEDARQEWAAREAKKIRLLQNSIQKLEMQKEKLETKLSDSMTQNAAYKRQITLWSMASMRVIAVNINLNSKLTMTKEELEEERGVRARLQSQLKALNKKAADAIHRYDNLMVWTRRLEECLGTVEQALVSFKRERIISHMVVSSDATSHLSKLFEERKELEDERMTISSAIGAQEAIVRRLESELQEHMKSSAIDENGDIDHAHTRKKNRLHNDLDKAIDILSRQRSKLSSIEAKVKELEGRRQATEGRLKSTENDLLKALLDEQKQLFDLVKAIGPSPFKEEEAG